MKTHYLQISYHLPYNANSSLDSITVSEHPINEVVTNLVVATTHSNGAIYSILTDNISKVEQTLDVDSEKFDSNVSIIDSNDEYQKFKILNVKIESSADYIIDNLETDIKQNYDINGSDEFNFNIPGVTVIESSCFTSSDEYMSVE